MIHTPIIGVEMHCPDCRRKLVTFNGDGTANLAGKAVAYTMAEEYIDEYGDICHPDVAVVMEAICLRRACKRKRFVHNVRYRIRRI